MPMRNKTSWEDDDFAGSVSAERAKINRYKKIQRVVMFLGSFAFLCIMVSFSPILARKYRVLNWSYLRHDIVGGHKNFYNCYLQGSEVPFMHCQKSSDLAFSNVWELHCPAENKCTSLCSYPVCVNKMSQTDRKTDRKVSQEGNRN